MATIFKIWFSQREPHPEMWLLETVTLFSVPNLSVSLGACWHTCSTHLSDTSLTCFLFYTNFSVFPLSYALQCCLSLLGFAETLKAVNQESFVFLPYRPWQVYNLTLFCPGCFLQSIPSPRAAPWGSSAPHSVQGGQQCLPGTERLAAWNNKLIHRIK